MAEGSLAPFFIQINYRSSYGEHVQTIPLIEWTPGGATGDLALQGSGTDVAVDVISGFLGLQAPFFPTTVNFYAWTIFSQPTSSSPAIPVMSAACDVDGTNATAANTKAVQATWTLRCDDASLFKIMQMDMNNGNNFGKITISGLSAEALLFLQYLVGDECPFQSRLNGRPLYFRQISYTLNEKLRRQYHMN